MRKKEFFMSEWREALNYLEKLNLPEPELAVVLGTGMGKILDDIEVIHEEAYSNIPHFPTATVESHSGKLVFGTYGGRRLVIMSGRFHAYEGYTAQRIALPIWVMSGLGAKALILSNAAGGMRQDLVNGDLVLVEDHINLQGSNPLVGPNDDSLGPRFPDMSEPYHPELRRQLHQAALEEEIRLKEGVYVAVLGPCLETRAEYRFLHRIGADVVGMSTVPEVIAAVHCGMPCAAISLVTDECDPDNLKPVDIASILEVAGKAEPVLVRLMQRFVRNLDLGIFRA